MAVFIDADNFNDSTALDRVLLDVRALADRIVVRRAYGRPESLKAIEAVLWKHGVRPVANLIVDKTTTGSALVIDAVQAVCRGEFDLVAICSGDADFVPLALWLREEGCRTLCYSLDGKIFANPESFYDEVIVLELIAPSLPVSANDEATARNGTTGESSTTVRKNSAPQKAPTPAARKPSAQPVVAVQLSVKQILGALPELRNKAPLHLSKAAKKLKDAKLLAKNASSVAVFSRFPAQFRLTPAKQPNTVTYLGQ